MSKKSDRIIKTITLILSVLFLTQITTLLIVGIENKGFKKKDGYVFNIKNEFVYSDNMNFTILLLDQFDGRVFSDLLYNHSEYVDKLDGFTFFRNTTTRYGFTDCSIPQIITGEDYLGQKSFNRYLEDAYTNSPLLNKLKEKEYTLNMYPFIQMPNDASQMFENYEFVKLGVSSKRRLVTYIYKLVGYRYLPYYFRQFCWFYSDDLLDLRYIESVDGESQYDEDRGTVYNWANTYFYDGIDNIEAISGNKMFHFIHLRGNHTPINFSRDCQYVEEGVSEAECAEGCFHMLTDYVDKLKEVDAYDNNVIIIMSDHGSYMETGEGRRQNGLLLIKGVDEHHALEVSDAVVSYTELSDIYANLLDNKTGLKSVNGIKEGESRFYYSTADDDHNKLVEYVINGKAYNVNDIEPTGRLFSLKIPQVP